MGTGVGGGIVINKNLHQGRTNMVVNGDIISYIQMETHVIVETSGCVETYLSGPALESRWTIS